MPVLRDAGYRLQEAVVRRVNHFYQQNTRPELFLMDAETAHDWAIEYLQPVEHSRILRRAVSSLGAVRDSRLSQSIWGLDFVGAVGEAAGFDKHIQVPRAMPALGFNALELGAFTPLPQEGNPKPRLFRVVKFEALINRMGFNNKGVEAARCILAKLGRLPVPVGINLGKGKDTPLESAAKDYVACLITIYDYGDYFVINISSPNTKDLRKLQSKEYLRALLREIIAAANMMARARSAKRKPILVKISPDLSWREIDDILEICDELGIDGIEAVNTTLDHSSLKLATTEVGGLSGPVLLETKTIPIIRYIAQRTEGRLPIIGVGGINSGQSAFAVLKAGAWILQILTALPYKGPLVVPAINLELLRLMKQEGFTHISQIRQRR